VAQHRSGEGSFPGLDRKPHSRKSCGRNDREGCLSDFGITKLNLLDIDTSSPCCTVGGVVDALIVGWDGEPSEWDAAINCLMS
jgi:hypothetical protein